MPFFFFSKSFCTIFYPHQHEGSSFPISSPTLAIDYIFFKILVILVSVRGKVMAPHSSTLAWKIPWMEEPGRLQSMGFRRVGHD